METTFTSHSVAETEEYGRQLAATLHGGMVVALYGDLGMGKTAMVRGIAAGLGLQAEVSSPTFALVHMLSEEDLSERAAAADAEKEVEA